MTVFSEIMHTLLSNGSEHGTVVVVMSQSLQRKCMKMRLSSHLLSLTRAQLTVLRKREEEMAFFTFFLSSFFDQFARCVCRCSNIWSPKHNLIFLNFAELNEHHFVMKRANERPNERASEWFVLLVWLWLSQLIDIYAFGHLMSIKYRSTVCCWRWWWRCDFLRMSDGWLSHMCVCLCRNEMRIWRCQSN